MSKIWTQKPPVGTKINWGHPLTRGLVAAWYMNEAGGLVARDLVSGQDLVLSTAFFVNDGIRFNGSATATARKSTFDLGTPMKGTVIVKAKTDNVGSVKNIVSLTNTNDWYLTFRGSSNLECGTHNGRPAGNLWYTNTSGITLVNNKYYVIAYQCDGSASNIRLFIDGKLNNSGKSDWGDAPWPGQDTVKFGKDGLLGNVAFCLIYNRYLSLTEVQGASLAPFQILVRRRGGAVKAPTAFEIQRQNIIDGLVSAQSETHGWNNEVKAKIPVSAVVRTSDTVVTITLPEEAAYDITEAETITATMLATAVAGGAQIVATPNLEVSTSGAGAQTAAFTPLALSLAVPAITATRAEVYSATFTPLAVSLAVPTTTASYACVKTAAFTALAITITQPSIAASYAEVDTAVISPLVLSLAIPAVTATYVAVLSAAITPAALILTVPSTIASFLEVDSAAFAPLSLVLSVSTMSASVVGEFTAAFTPLSLNLTQPSIAASYVQEHTAAFSPLAVTVSPQTLAASVTESYEAEFAPVDLTLTIPSVTASEGYVVAGFSPLSLLITIPNRGAVVYRETISLTSTITKSLSASSDIDKSEALTGTIGKSVSLLSHIGEA